MNTQQHRADNAIVRTLRERGIDIDECSACLEKASALLALLLHQVQSGEFVDARLATDAGFVREKLIALSTKLKRDVE